MVFVMSIDSWWQVPSLAHISVIITPWEHWTCTYRVTVTHGAVRLSRKLATTLSLSLLSLSIFVKSTPDWLNLRWLACE